MLDHDGTAVVTGYSESANQYADWKVRLGYAWVKSLKFQRGADFAFSNVQYITGNRPPRDLTNQQLGRTCSRSTDVRQKRREVAQVLVHYWIKQMLGGENNACTELSTQCSETGKLMGSSTALRKVELGRGRKGKRQVGSHSIVVFASFS